MSSFLRRTWAEVNLNNIEYNFKVIKSKAAENAKIMAVVKADAYGHGVETLSKEFEKLGADAFAVSNIDEALQLRNYGTNKPILILGFTPVEYAKMLSDNNISQAVLSKDYAERLAKQAEKDGVSVKVHIKIDTGMSRIGFYHHSLSDDTAVNEIFEILQNETLIPEGIFTHFATADYDNDPDGAYTKKQFELFTDCIEKLSEKGISFKLRHCSNSAATLENKEYHLDMVRPGIILYGLNPSKYFEKYGLKPAFTLKSVISLIKELEIGDTVSYGKTFTAEKKMKIATVPIGYADGYSRSLSNKGYVIIRGKKAKILGRVCMDQMMVDITDIPEAKTDDEVILFGSELLTTEAFSSLCDTITYEIVCLVGKRVPRVYIKGDKIVGITDQIYSQGL